MDGCVELDTKRGRFEVIDRGSGGKSGKTLVLIHGFPLAASSWQDDAAALSSRMRIIAPSMRGFGTSAMSPMMSIDAMADDVAAILDALAVSEPLVVGGLSMGGYITLAFARRHAARLRALVLADTRAEPDGAEARANRDIAIARVEGGDLAGFVDGLFEIILAPTTRADRPDVVERIRTMALSADPRAVVAALRALRDRPDARPGLPDIAVPALVIVGEHDALTPPSASQAIVEAMSRGLASLHVIPRAGHVSNFEQPEAFRDAVTEFMDRM